MIVTFQLIVSREKELGKRNWSDGMRIANASESYQTIEMGTEMLW